MAFPAPSLAAPSLSLYQFSYKGLAFGGIPGLSGAYNLRAIPKGLEPPPVLSADVQRALEQGEFIGADVLPGRDIEIDQIITNAGAGIDHNRQALSSVLAVGGVTEEPLYLKLLSGTFACMARPRKHSAPFDVNTLVGGGCNAFSMLHATDPRWYGAPSQEAAVSLTPTTGGMHFPAVFPIVFGGLAANMLSVTNAGNFEMRPILIVEGPVVDPILFNNSIPGEPYIRFNLTLEMGDQLVIDTDFERAVYYPSGSAGAERRATRDTTWWNLPPGISTIAFDAVSSEAGAQLIVQYANAFSGL